MTQIHRVVAGWALLVMLCLPAAAATNLSDLELSGYLTIGTSSTGTDLQLYGATTGANLLWDASDDRLEGSGNATLLIGENTTGVTTAGGTTMIYGYASHATNALTGELIGVRGNARCNVASASGSVIGGKFQAGNMSAGYNLSAARGIYIDVVNKTPSASTATWTYARGVEVSMDLDQGAAGYTNTVTNAYMFYGVYNAPTAGSYSTITNGYGIFVRNEAVGGTGQQLDAAFYADNLNHSGGIKGWDYGLDFGGIDSSGFGSADIRLAHGETISNNPDATIQLRTSIVRHRYDAAASWTATQADAGGVTFDSISDGTAGFTFSDAVTLGVDGTGTDLQLYGDTASSNLLWDMSDDRLEGVGETTLSLGETTTGYDAASPNPMIYARYFGKTTALTGTGRAVRGRAQIIVDSASGTLRAGQFEAGNGSYSSSGDGVNLAVATGLYAGVTTSTAGGAKTLTHARGIEVNLDWDQANTTITNGTGIWMKFNAGSSPSATHGTVYGIYIDNEAVGGTGQQFDAGLYISDTNMSGGVKGWNYGIDLSSATFNTADIRLSSSITISSGSGSPDGSITATQGSLYIDTAGGADAQLFINESGSTGWCKVDTTT